MPQKPRIKARDAVRDIRSGMDDYQLMEKYGLSSKGLESLLGKLVGIGAITQAELDQRRAAYSDAVDVRPIDGSDMITDIRSGMSDSELMEKYGLSSEGLAFALQTLMDTKVITPQELYGDTVLVEDVRQSPRKYLAVPVVVCESDNHENRGEVSDICEDGVGIGTVGIEAKAGERRIFEILAEDFIGAERITFEAECRWVKKDEDSGEWSAGFSITKISEECQEDLERLIESLPFL